MSSDPQSRDGGSGGQPAPSEAPRAREINNGGSWGEGVSSDPQSRDGGSGGQPAPSEAPRAVRSTMAESE
ncbi:hypothetical protein [Parvularcula bermudensis]|uniref:hypothetical protein n=1 Tax=Parvularcula bermudensis TaxID=208216 RepID=UPI0002E7F625|nr:hypothetical protein [Parvularcula bermudensis]